MPESLLPAARRAMPQPAVLTGGSGRLGRELTSLLPDLLAPPSSELNVLEPHDYLTRARPALVIHAAAYTDVAKAETDRAECWHVNVEGTRRLAQASASLGAHFVLISTDYVFSGEHGNYSEDDTPGPVLNHYALSKLVAEEVARTAVPREQLLVIRTSFRAREWPHPKAFSDLFTSQDYIDVLAPQLALAISRAAEIPFDTLHVAGRRRSSLELARERSPQVEPALRADAGVKLPADVSLDTGRWRELLASWTGVEQGSRLGS